MKQCRICYKIQPYSQFYTRPDTKDGYRSECKDCCGKHNRQYWREVYYPANREKHISRVMARKQP